MKKPFFLTLAEIVRIHADQIERYGGRGGIRDIRLLESAAAQPEASFEGEWLHRDLFEMAAAYAFHVALNHPFVDGNKRVGLAAALVFLELNGVSIRDPRGKLSDAMFGMAAGRVSKRQFGGLLRALPRK